MHVRHRASAIDRFARSRLLLLALPAVAACGAGEASDGRHAEALSNPAAGHFQDAGAPVDAASDASSGADAAAHDASSVTIPPYALIASAKQGWYAGFAAAATRQAYGPLPPLESPDDVEQANFQGTYDGEVSGVPVNGFKPLGASSFENPAGAAIAASYVLEPTGDANNLFALTDFSRHDEGGRFTVGCERYFANTTPVNATAAPLRDLCAARGKAVSAWNAADLKTRGVKLVRARECALPSGAYGAYQRDAADKGSFSFNWPNFLDRDPKYAQPCVGAFVDVEAKDVTGAVMGRGWMFVKAVTDLSVVPFPYQERDPASGDVNSRDGAPRGEFVTSRWIYNEGIGAYLGQSPIWLLDRASLAEAQKPEFFASKIAACGADAKPPCILGKQAPFLFPISADSIWIRSAMDTSDPRWHDPMLDNSVGRNDYETSNAVSGNVDIPTDIARNTLHYFMYKTLPTSPAALTAQAEQLSAMWYSVDVYRGLYAPGGDRMRVAIVRLDKNHILAIPDQGYIPLGTPSPALWAALGAADVGQMLHGASTPLAEKDFVVVDAMGEAQ